MLRELKSVKKDGDFFRRWFQDELFDLIVWYDHHHEVSGFQLCYDKFINEHAVTWWRNTGFSHDRIDDGEASPLETSAPVLGASKGFPRHRVIKCFAERSIEIDPKVTRLVIQKLEEYSS